jgi:hypothetical protein
MFDGIKKITALEDLPFIPVSVFKNHALKSIPDHEVYKILTSSGTTGDVPSRVFLDNKTANLQSLAMSRIMSHVIGKSRLPMLIVDSRSVIKDRASFSARGAGILGMSVLGRNHEYLLDAEYNVDAGALKKFVDQFNGQKLLIFGFTFMIWKYLFLNEDVKLDLSNAILIHSGGWKKMNDLEVNNEVFKTELNKKYGLKHIRNFYGMIEQVGAIYLEDDEGYLHCPNVSEIIIRNPVDFSVQKKGMPGVIQLISALPQSYPGHSILSEDIGVCMGEDEMEWQGKFFKVSGRIRKADLRGCSDTFGNDSEKVTVNRNE